MAALFLDREVLCKVIIKITPPTGGFLLPEVHTTKSVMWKSE